MQKISSLLVNVQKYSYILGGILAFFNHGGDCVYFCARKKRQKTNDHIGLVEQCKKLKSDLEKMCPDFAFEFIPPDSSFNKFHWNSSYFGVVAEFHNDTALSWDDLYKEIFVRIDSTPFCYENFFRGIMESGGSVDATAGYLTRDISPWLGHIGVVNICKIAGKIFSKEFININPRFNQPCEKSKNKYTQLRINLDAYLDILGSFSPIVSWEVKNAAFKCAKLRDKSFFVEQGLLRIECGLREKNVPFNSVHERVFSAMRDIDSKHFAADLEKYGINRSDAKSAKRVLLASTGDVKEEQDEVSRNISESTRNEILRNYRFRDAITNAPLQKTEGGYLVCHIHHIIPFGYRGHVFKENETWRINEIWNLIPLAPDTHSILHHSRPVDHLMLQKMYYLSESRLKDLSVSLASLEQMYK